MPTTKEKLFGSTQDQIIFHGLLSPNQHVFFSRVVFIGLLIATDDGNLSKMIACDFETMCISQYNIHMFLHCQKLHILWHELCTCAVFLETSKLHKHRLSSLMLINLSCLPVGHQRILLGSEGSVRNSKRLSKCE